VASFHTWKQIPATDGHLCRVRKGETALRVYAPLRSKRREFDPDTGEMQEPSIVGFKLVPVFHQGQLSSFVGHRIPKAASRRKYRKCTGMVGLGHQDAPNRKETRA
jgi:hypothetical protein